MKTFPHVRKAFQGKKIQGYLDKFPPEYWFETYGKFWVLQEVLSLNNNLININDIEQITYDYMGNNDGIAISEDDIEIMLDSEVISKDEENNIYSPFQKMIIDSKLKTGKAKMYLDDLNTQIEAKEKLIKRLNDKVDFIKSRKLRTV